MLGWPMILEATLLAGLVAFGVSGLAGRGRPRRIQYLAGIGIALGFLAAFITLAGGLPFQAGTADHPVGEVALVTLGAGLLAGLLGRRGQVVLAVASGLFGALWCLGGMDLLSEADPLLALAGVILALPVMHRLITLEAEGPVPLVLLAIASVGLAGVASAVRAGLSVDLALALGAACLGWLVWARWFGGQRAGPAALIPAGAILVAIGITTARTALHPPWSLVLLPLCFYMDRIVVHLPVLARRVKRKAARRRVLLFGATVPALCAALVALSVRLG